MNTENDSNYADIENLIKLGNSGAPIADLSPNSDWNSSYPQSSYSCSYGLPYQDHNYGAPPPVTPPPSPGSKAPAIKRAKTFDVGEALKSIKPNKAVPERKTKHKQTVKRQNSRLNKQAATATTPVKTESRVAEPVKVEPPVVSSPESDRGEENDGGGGGGGDYEDSITRCICNYTHDDGYMICCDQCQVWQHIDCMGIDRSNIPDEYSCEQCMPRKVYKARARLRQKNKLEELKKNSQQSEDENANSKRPNSLNIKPSNKNKLQPASGQKKKLVGSGQNGTISAAATSAQNAKKKGGSNNNNAIISGPALRSKRQGKGGSTDTVFLSVDGDAEESPWSAPYESATENQYSTDIQESLNTYKSTQSVKLPSLLTELDNPRCQLKLLTNGRRGLKVDTVIPADQALIEFKGKVMLQQQFVQENDFITRPQPFVLFYDQWDGLEMCVDASSFGNEARFVQRSCVPNAEVRHVIENGQIHLVLFSVKEIADGSEVTIPFDFDFKSCEYCVECACVRAQCPVRKAARKMKKSNSQGSAAGDYTSTAAGSKANHAHKQNKTSSSATTHLATPPVKRNTHEQLKVQIPDNDISMTQQHTLMVRKPARQRGLNGGLYT